LAVLALIGTIGGCLGATNGIPGELRLGFFATLTHAPALFAVSTGLLKADLPAGSKIQTTVFGSGPDAFQALLAGQVDVLYVGPSPTIAALESTRAAQVEVIAGSTSGGALFVEQPNLNMTAPNDFANRTFATPQLGNTQDVALKFYLRSLGLRTKDSGGPVTVINAANADILLLFKQGKIDGAWVPEPYATRLQLEDNAKPVLNEASLWPGGQFATTEVVTTKGFVSTHGDIVRGFLKAHVEAIVEMQRNASRASLIVNSELTNLTGKPLRADELQAAMAHLNFTWDPMNSSLQEDAVHSQQLGLSSNGLPPAQQIFDLTPLNEVLRARGAEGVRL
jgi:NitT/TauT family transport system substrate-binding protein